MYLNAVARHQGYAVAIKSHKKRNQHTIRLYLRCSLGHKVPSVAHKRSASSKKTGCLFEVSLNYRNNLDRWVVCQDLKKPEKLAHNHEPFDNPHNLSIYRRFNPAAKDQIDLLSSAGVRASNIKSLINIQPGSQPLLRDIHNVRTRLRDNWLKGRSPIQGLFDLILASHWAHRTLTSADGRLLNLFFASPSGIRLARRFPTVLSMDCTYKTNRFNLPLLHIVGTTNTHRSFTVAMCFLSNEKQEQYEWALHQLKEIIYQDEDANSTAKEPQTFATDAESALINAISTVFPQSVHILCVWHINHNIAKNCKSKFSESDWTVFMKLWNAFVSSTSTSEYDTNLEAVTMAAKAHQVFAYLESTWLGRSDKFVTLFTSKTPHFGNSSTSRTEGSHYRAKKILDGRHNDFITCFNAFKRFEEHQTSETMILVGIEQTKTLQGLPEFFRDLHGVVSHFALKKLKSKYDSIPDTQHKPCTKTFRGAWGLPCSHELASQRDQTEYLSPDLIHLQWKLVMEVLPDNHDGLIAAARVKFAQLLEVPEHSLQKLFGEIGLLQTGLYSLVPIMNADVKVDTRGRPRAGNTTRKRVASPEGRWKSDMELAEDAKRPRVSRCSLCHTAGHKITTCALRRASTSGPSTRQSVALTTPDSAPNKPLFEDLHSIQEEDPLLDLDSDQTHDEDPGEWDSPESTYLISHDSSSEDHSPEASLTDEDECPFCLEPLPATPSKRLSELKALLLSMPNSHQLSVSIFFSRPFSLRKCL